MLTFSQAKAFGAGCVARFSQSATGHCKLEEIPHGSADVVDSLVDAAVDDLFLEGSEKHWATPLVSGSPTKAKLAAMPQNLIWFWKWSASTPDWSAVASPISSHTMRSTRSHRRAYPYLAESRSSQALRSNLLKPYPVAKSP